MKNIVFPALVQRTKTVTDKQKQDFNKKHKIVNFPIDGYVMIRKPEKPGKLELLYKGPYQIVNVTRGDSYILKDMDGLTLPRQYPPSALKSISLDEEFTEDDLQ